MAKFKEPKKEQSDKIRTPTATDTAPQQRKPKFSFEFLSRDYCIQNCTQDEKAAFSSAMYTLTQLTWAQINQAPRHGLGCEKITRSAIKTSVPEVITEDVNIIAFRFFGKAPMVGFRRDETFFVVWFDRVFTLYNH